jgi:hypothetical protein
VDAEPAGDLPQADLVGKVVGLLGQLPLLPVGTGLREGVARSGPRSVGRVASSFGSI